MRVMAEVLCEKVVEVRCASDRVITVELLLKRMC